MYEQVLLLLLDKAASPDDASCIGKEPEGLPTVWGAVRGWW